MDLIHDVKLRMWMLMGMRDFVPRQDYGVENTRRTLDLDVELCAIQPD
nr:hypothetical protein [Salinibacterium hongtaonis]